MLIQIVATILGFIIIVVTTIVTLKMRKDTQKVDVSPNLPIAENPCRREFSGGYYSLLIKNQTLCKNGCTRIEGFPMDIDQGENKPKPPLQCFIVKNEFIKRFARGDLSPCREIIKFIGRSPTDMPESMRDTDEGAWMTKEGQKAWLKSTFGKMIPAGDEAIAEAMKDYARGQVAKNTFQEIKEINRKNRELLLKEPTEQSEPKKP